MDHYLLSAQTATLAQRMAQSLRRCGVPSQIQRMPSTLARQGCGFALRLLPEDLPAARDCLEQGRIFPKRVYLYENGYYREVSI